jgi:hypothetical protein
MTFPDVKNQHLMHMIRPRDSATNENRVIEEDEAIELQKRKY